MFLVGLDECGRGSLAGPLVACACTFLEPLETFSSQFPCKLNDSKKIPKHHRETIASLRDSLPIRYQIMEISVEDINLHGIAWANVQAFVRLSEQFPNSQIIADGNIRFDTRSITSVIKADTIYPEVMLASVIAKVHRDGLMSGLSEEYPGYNWENNAGYGTKNHLEALNSLGATPQHRTVFVRTALRNLKVC